MGYSSAVSGKAVFKSLARLIPDNSFHHEKLVIGAAPSQFNIWHACLNLAMCYPHFVFDRDTTAREIEDCVVWTREPVYWVIIEDRWNGSYPTSETRLFSIVSLAQFTDEGPHVARDAFEYMSRDGGDGKQSVQEACDEWVNFSSFLARLIKQVSFSTIDAASTQMLKFRTGWITTCHTGARL